MHRIHLIRLALALAGAAFFAQGALAGGEPKNQPPFTRHTPRTLAALPSGTGFDVRGEPKNQLPFTRLMSR